jgi:hypothetical protein
MRYSNGHAASLFSCHFSLRLCLILLENCFCALAFRGCLIKVRAPNAFAFLEKQELFEVSAKLALQELYQGRPAYLAQNGVVISPA